MFFGVKRYIRLFTKRTDYSLVRTVELSLSRRRQIPGLQPQPLHQLRLPSRITTIAARVLDLLISRIKLFNDGNPILVRLLKLTERKPSLGRLLQSPLIHPRCPACLPCRFGSADSLRQRRIPPERQVHVVNRRAV